MFELTKSEHQNLRSQIATSRWGGTRYAPMVFTEHGILMISSVLKSDRAIQVNIQIMRAFVKFREILSTHQDLEKKIIALEKRSDERFEIVFQTLDQLLSIEKSPNKKIGYIKEELSEYK